MRKGQNEPPFNLCIVFVFPCSFGSLAKNKAIIEHLRNKSCPFFCFMIFKFASFFEFEER